ncbi:hypothetical protein NQZ79_g8617 [Umbelopsis isabellina]|nr:hypothetical protein NQZ79_g8617 [Umbelopsis isabellina]
MDVGVVTNVIQADVRAVEDINEATSAALFSAVTAAAIASSVTAMSSVTTSTLATVTAAISAVTSIATTLTAVTTVATAIFHRDRHRLHCRRRLHASSASPRVDQERQPRRWQEEGLPTDAGYTIVIQIRKGCFTNSTNWVHTHGPPARRLLRGADAVPEHRTSNATRAITEQVV